MKVAQNKMINKLSSWLGWFCVVSIGLALFMYAYLGIFSRYYADDYCMSALASRSGFWPAQWIQYTTWSNRFAGMFTLTASDFLGPVFIRIWPMLVLVLWMAGLGWALFQLAKALGASLPLWIPALVAEWTIFITLLFAPNLYQSLFWRVGLITYTLPLALMAFLLGMMVAGYRKIIAGRKAVGTLIAVGFLAFWTGGFSETCLALEVGILVIGLFFSLIRGSRDRVRRAARWPIFSALAGAFLASIVVLLSPGNAVRQAAMPATPGILTLVKMDAINAFLFIYLSMKNNALQMFLAILGPAFVFYLYFASRADVLVMQPASLVTGLFSLPVAGFYAVAVVVLPAAYAQSSYPDGRVLIVAGFALALVLSLAGCLVGLSLSRLHQLSGDAVPVYLKILSAFLVFLVFLYPIYDAAKSYRQIPEYRAQAQAWDERDASIRQAKLAGESDIEAMSLNAPGGMSELRVDPNDWVNGCVAAFYGVRRIMASP
jgi:hypothetical protein